jgi:N utilization substance protein A
VSNELAGERVDIILWDDNPAQFVINAMSPAEVISIVMDEESGSMDVAVGEDQLSQAIGRGGQNVRLASQLTGWTLNVMTEVQAEEKHEVENERVIKHFMDEMDVDEEISRILAEEGFSSVEEIAYVPIEELQSISEFDDDLVEALRSRAKDIQLTREIASEEQGGGPPSEDLLETDGMDAYLAEKLASSGVRTRDDLADLATDELVEMSGIEEERAAALIMTARASWFEDEDEA